MKKLYLYTKLGAWGLVAASSAFAPLILNPTTPSTFDLWMIAVYYLAVGGVILTAHQIAEAVQND